MTIATWFNTSVIQPLKKLFADLWNGVTTGLKNAWNWIVNLASTIAAWVNNTVVKPVKNFFTGMWDGLKNGAKSAWEGVKSTFSSVTTFFGDTFKAAWEKVKAVFSTGGKIFDGIKDGVLDAFKKVVNTIIKGINTVVSKPFNGLNTILNKISDISIVGVKPFSWLTWRAPIPEIPLLAKGAVIPANNPFLAVLGDQTSGTNIEAPLSTIQEAVANELDGFASVLVSLQQATVSILGELLSGMTGFSSITDVLQDLRDTAKQTAVGSFDPELLKESKTGVDYEALVSRLSEVLKSAPIQPQVTVEMRDGDVYLDKERVGRSISPVVSRVIVQKS